MKYCNRSLNVEQFSRYSIILSLCIILISSLAFIIYLLLIKCIFAALGFGTLIIFIVMLIFWMSSVEVEYLLLTSKKRKKYLNPICSCRNLDYYKKKKSHFDVESCSIKASSSINSSCVQVSEKRILKNSSSKKLRNERCCCGMNEMLEQFQTIDCCSECAQMRLEMDELVQKQACVNQHSNLNELVNISETNDLNWYISLKRVGKDSVVCQLKNKGNLEIDEKSSKSNESKRKKKKKKKEKSSKCKWRKKSRGRKKTKSQSKYGST